MVSFWDAVAYCNALSQLEGRAPCYTTTGCAGTPGTAGYSCTDVTFSGLACTGYRLPTEAEWEYAARAGTTGAFYTGPVTATGATCADDPNLDLAGWYCSDSNSVTHPVQGKQANAWGLHDMLGNVWEWCWDWHAPYPGSATDYTGPTSGAVRVIRGGGFGSNALDARAARRSSVGPDNRYEAFGFRPCRSAP